MPLIDKETVQKITDRADIVEVVGDYVHLVRRGANYMGLCPFHNERTPSFSVNKRKNFCYCFSCKQGGSPINFIMKKEGLSYHEALLHLAKKYGIEVRERELTDEERKYQTERESMFVANEWAMKQMKHNLLSTEEGREIGLSYFYGQRKITQEALEAFNLGYAIDKGYSLISDAKKAGIDIDVLKKVGLVGTSADGRDYDKYRGRVIFPILNTSGKVIGFGGRTLKNDKAKYINSPESEIYKKSNELYGIFQARSAIGREDKCFLVEGYFDVIGMWQSGFRNVVASSGTALTDGQISLIHRFTENITLIYDGDNAGIKAALRGVDMLLHHKMKVKVLLLPNGEDPDSFARNNSPEEFRSYLEKNETDVITFKAKVLVTDMRDDPQQRIIALRDMVTTLAHISDQISRDVYIQECSRLMNIPEDTILKAVVKKRFELIEQWKRERTRKDFSSFSPSREESGKPKDQVNINNAAERPLLLNEAQSLNNEFIPKKDVVQEKKASKINDNSQKKLYDLEKHLVEYALKYGFIPFCEVKDEISLENDIPDNKVDEIESQNKPKFWNVLEFILNDLNSDDIRFTNTIFSDILSYLVSMTPDFHSSKLKKEEELKELVSKMRKDGIEKIAEKGLSISDIEKEEKKLEADINYFTDKELYTFEKNFPIRQLSNHERDDIREMVNELAVERHQLSNIYYRENYNTEKEEDKLLVLVPRALNELKTEILDIRIKELFSQLSIASKEGDEDLEKKLQGEINDKILLRSEMAKSLGERILSPNYSRHTIVL